MPVLTVLLAPPGSAEGVLDVLTDLSGAGLLAPFLWTDPGTDPGIDAVVVDAGVRRPTTVSAWLADHRYDRVRLGVLVAPAGAVEPLDRAAEREVLALLEGGAGGAPVTRVRCVLHRGEPGARPDTVARRGWHNLLVAPEDAFGPATGHTVLEPTADAVDVGRYAAPVIAGALGMWTGLPGCRLDDEPVPGEPRLRAVRAFYRRIDAADVEHALRARVLATQPDLPLPRRPFTPVGHVDPGGACELMARHLWARHGAHLTGERSAAPQGPGRPGYGRAVRWLPGFVLATVRNRLDGWYTARIAESTAPAAAELMRRAVVDAGDAHDVLATGVTRSGVLAGWSELGAAAARFDTAVADRAAPFGAHRADLTALWDDYEAGALTLVDAGDHSPAMPPVPVGAGLGVLRSADQCVPDHDADFAVTDGSVAASTQMGVVPAGDVLGADLLARRLAHLAAGDPTLRSSAERTASELAAWSDRHRSTYSVRVGQALADRISELEREVRGHLTTLAAGAGGADVSVGRHQRQRSAGNVATGLTAAALLVVVVAAVIAVGAPVVALLAVLTAAVLWFAAAPVAFLFGQRDLRAELGRRADVSAAAEQHIDNLRRSVGELRRLTEAYHLFLLRSRAVAEVLRNPFGRPQPPPAPLAPLVGGLPRSTRTGRAEADPATLSAVAAALRRELFAAGWLGEVWRRNLDDGPDAAGEDAPPEERWRRRVQRLLAEGPTTGSGDAVWARAVRMLHGDGPLAGSGASLLSAVRVAGHPEPEALPLFLAGIDDPGPGDRWFDRSSFTAAARAADRAEIAGGAAVAVGVRGLSRVLSLVQTNAPGPPTDFVVATEPARTTGKVLAPEPWTAEPPTRTGTRPDPIF